ncbi:MAG: hypothetical protein WCM76_11645 [Bacteroidota bacterium]
MKRLLLPVILLLLAAYRGLAGPGTVFIEGKIEHFKNREVSLGYYKDFLYYKKVTVVVVKADRDGYFQLHAKWPKAWPAYLFFNGKPLSVFLSPGDSIYIDGNAKKILKSAVFEGKGAKENNLLCEYLRDYLKDEADFRKKMQKYEERDFFARNKEIQKNAMTFIDKGFSEADNPKFYQYIRAMAVYQSYSNILLYYKNNSKVQIDTATIDGLIEEDDINNPDALTSSVYIDFLQYYSDYLVEYKKTDNTEIENYWDYRYRVLKSRFSGQVRDLLLAKVLRKAFQYTHRVTARILFYDYQNVYIDKEYFLAIKNDFVKQ